MKRVSNPEKKRRNIIFGKDTEGQESLKGAYTATKINQQPNTWKKAIKQVEEHKEEIKVFIEDVTKHDGYDIILTDAGASGFVGSAIFTYASKGTNYKTKSYAAIDIVIAPENYLSQTKPILLIFYECSGNSPKSVGAVDVADEVCGKNLYHLFIIYSHEGAFSEAAEKRENAYAINLTPEAYNQSFAMTSNFPNMMLATLLCFSPDNLDEVKAELEDVIKAVEGMPVNDWESFKDAVGAYGFGRIVYLGTNCLKGITQGSQLGILELTARRAATMYDSSMGLCHGSKPAINDDAPTIVYLSGDPYTRQYEVDLIKKMSSQRKGNKLITVMNKRDEEVAGLVDYAFLFDLNNEHENTFFGLDYIAAIQVLALFKSLSYDITPDSSRPTGEVNRAVKGIILHPYTKRQERRI